MSHICKECGKYRDFGKKGKYCIFLKEEVMGRDEACNEFITPRMEASGFQRGKTNKSWNAIDREARRGKPVSKSTGIKPKGLRKKAHEDYRSDALKAGRVRTHRRD